MMTLWQKIFLSLRLNVIYRLKLKTYEEVHILISQYIDFYNNQCIQLKIKLTPSEKRSQYIV